MIVRNPSIAPQDTSGVSGGVVRTRASVYRVAMCRSIKTLRRAETAATTGELEAAARQYVRKLSGYRVPSARNADAFEGAVTEIALASRRLMEAIGVAVEEGQDRWVSSGARRDHGR
jgi:hypothetical protein